MHLTRHWGLQRGGKKTYVCCSVCGGGESCKGDSCAFVQKDLEVMIPHTRQRGIQGKCPARVLWSRHNEDGCWRVNVQCSIFNHHTDFSDITGSAVVTAVRMWWLPVAHSMDRNHPDMSAPAFTRAVLDSVGGSLAQSARTVRRTLANM